MVDMDTRSPLGELIESARKLAGYSQQDVADRATIRGFEMAKQSVNRLVNEKPLKSINANHVKGIAAALGFSEARVAAEALASMGVNLGYAATPLRQAILDAVEIDERTKRSLLAILDIEQKAGGDSGTQTSTKKNEPPVGGQVVEADFGGPDPSWSEEEAAQNEAGPSGGQLLRDEQDKDGQQPDA